jgi:hypothetical protein
VVAALRPAESRLGREINPAVYPPNEFRAKLRAKNAFLRRVIAGQKVFVVGDDRDVARLAR